MRIAFNPSTVAALTTPPNNKDITFDLRGHNIFARGVKFLGTDTNTWRDIKINNVSIDSNILDLRDGDNTTLTNINGVVTINSTWRPVVDNLTSDSTTSSLSANLGRILKALIDGKSDSDHTHDDRYVKKPGDTMLGALNFANNIWNKVGDDVYIGDHNIGGQLCIMGANGTTGLSFHKYSDASIRKSITFDGNTLYMNGSCDYATLSNLTNLLAINTVPNKTAATSIGSWSPISGRYVFHQKWTDTSTGGDSADFGIYLDGNLTANMVLDGYYNSLLGFRVIGATGGFLKANGTIDNSTYLTSHLSLSNYYTKGEIDNQLGKYKLKSSIWVPETKIICSNFRDFLNKENLHKLAPEELNLYRFFAAGDESNYSSKYNYPVVDSHAMVFSIDGNNGYIRSMNFDLRSNDVYVTSRVANGEWRNWVKLLDTGNYSSILDSRYYTESEVNSLLDAKLNRQNLSYGNWNPRGWNLAADYHYNGGDLSISENNGKMYISVDGCFWLNEGLYRVLDTSDIGSIRGSITILLYLSNSDTNWYPLIWGGDDHRNTYTSTGGVYKSHDVLSWLTSSLTLYATRLSTNSINLQSNRGIYLVTSGGTSPLKGIRLPDLQSNGIGMFSKLGDGSGADEGGIIISADTSVIYNSFDTGWGLSVRDKDINLTDISGDNTIAFGVRQDYRAYSLGGFEKSGSDNSYVLLGGGDHKLESSLNVASASVASKVYGQVGDTGSHELVRCDMNNDQFRIIAGSSGNNNGWAEIATADDGNEPIYVRQYTGVFSSVVRTLTLLDANGYTHFPSYINIGGNENNNSSPDRVWGSNGSDSYLRSYRTSALNVNYASSAGNADTVDGFHASDFATAGHKHNNYLVKTTYDYHSEISFGLSGKCCLGKFPMYDSCVTIDIAYTTSGAYFGKLVIGTLNINSSRGGAWTARVFGDDSGVITSGLSIRYASGSNLFLVYFNCEGWGKFAAKIHCCALAGTPSDICTLVTSIPTDNLIGIIRAYNNPFNFLSSEAHIGCNGAYSDPLPGVDVNFKFGGVLAATHIYSNGGFHKNGSNDSYVLLGGGGHKLISDFASSSHSHNYAANENYGGFTKSGRLPISGFYQSEESESGGNAPWSSWMHLINCLHSNTNNNYALQIAASFYDNNTFKIRVTSDNVNNAWRDIIHSGNIGSQSVNYANSAGNADTATNAYHLRINSANTWSTWYWAGLSGQPSWLWGSNDGTNMYVWDPSNFNVNTALYLRSLGNLNCQTGRTLAYGDVYSYNTYNGNTGSPTTYSSVIGFGRGIAGTVEIAGGWCNTHLYWRSLRDCCEDWYPWRTVLDSSNYTEFINNYYWANVKISTSSSTTTSPTVHTLTATRVCAGHDPGIDNSISCSNWFRSSGNTGWYNTTYLGGWYMSDTSWIRAHNGVGIYTSGQIYSSSSIKMGNILLGHTDEINNITNGGIHLNYRNSGNVSLCQGGGSVGIGTTTPSYKLDVNGLVRASGFHHLTVNSDNYMLLAGGGYMIHKTGTTEYSTAILFGKYVWLTILMYNTYNGVQIVPSNISKPTKNIYVYGATSDRGISIWRISTDGVIHLEEGSSSVTHLYTTICYVAS